MKTFINWPPDRNRVALKYLGRRVKALAQDPEWRKGFEEWRKEREEAICLTRCRAAGAEDRSYGSTP